MIDSHHSKYNQYISDTVSRLHSKDLKCQVRSVNSFMSLIAFVNVRLYQPGSHRCYRMSAGCCIHIISPGKVSPRLPPINSCARRAGRDHAPRAAAAPRALQSRSVSALRDSAKHNRYFLVQLLAGWAGQQMW